MDSETRNEYIKHNKTPYVVFETGSFLAGHTKFISSKICYVVGESDCGTNNALERLKGVWTEEQLMNALKRENKSMCPDYALALKKLLIYKSLLKKLKGIQ